MHRHIVKSKACQGLRHMTLDEKIRYGMVAISGASLVFATLGLKVGPLEIIGGWGVS